MKAAEKLNYRPSILARSFKANRSFLIDRQGDIVARYDKIHMFDVTTPDGMEYRESNAMKPGDSVVTYSCEGRTIGCAICYDLRFSALFDALAKRGAVPSPETSVKALGQKLMADYILPLEVLALLLTAVSGLSESGFAATVTFEDSRIFFADVNRIGKLRRGQNADRLLREFMNARHAS